MAKADPQPALTLFLRKPVEFAGVTYDRLSMREPTALDMERCDALSGMAAVMDLIFWISGVPIGAVEKIGGRDLRDAREYLFAFGEPAALPPSITDADTWTLSLREPVTHGDHMASSLDLREPNGGEIKAVESLASIGATCKLISLVSSQPIELCRRIGMRDFRKAEAYLAGFI